MIIVIIERSVCPKVFHSVRFARGMNYVERFLIIAVARTVLRVGIIISTRTVIQARRAGSITGRTAIIRYCRKYLITRATHRAKDEKRKQKKLPPDLKVLVFPGDKRIAPGPGGIGFARR